MKLLAEVVQGMLAKMAEGISQDGLTGVNAATTSPMPSFQNENDYRLYVEQVQQELNALQAAAA